MDEFDRWNAKYRERFGRYLPLYQVGGTPEQLVEIIRECLETGIPVGADQDDEIVY